MPIQFKENERYQDYDAALYFRASGAEKVTFTTRVVKVVDEDVILVHIRATMPEDGRIIECDLWPRNEATKEDLAHVGEALENFEFRVGFFADPETGEITAGAPKHLLCHGAKREFRA